MADKATADNVAADIRPPQYRKAVQTMRSSIKSKKERVAKINTEIAEVWGTIDGYKVNRQAARIFMQLDKLKEEDRVDVMRSLNGLIEHAEWPDQSTDLVDEAEDNVVQMRVGGSGGGGEGGGEGGEESDEEPVDEPPAKGGGKKAAPPKGIVEGLEASRRHLGGGDALDVRQPH